MKIKITKEIKTILDSAGNRTRIKNAYKVYAAVYMASLRKRTDNYFYVPSTLLRSINTRYSRILELLKDASIIKYKSTFKIDPNDIFNQIESKTYSTKFGYCMQYKFLIDFEDCEVIEIDMKSGVKRRWYEVLSNSLIELGYPPEIKRDTFGRRVHYPLIQVYKTELQNKGLCIIDAKTSQPLLLWCLLKERDIIDPAYHQIFSNKLDFYNELAAELKLKDRKAAQKLFVYWINGKGKLRDYRIERLFPLATSFIRGLKNGNYKNSASFFQRNEAKIWIDDLLENIPVEFALPVHDSLIIKEQDYETVLAYCQSKYPEIRFNRKEIGE
ncbi:MAG: hypothetical protein WC716_04360 [Chitinophagaceae bacterium]|jgi:hypothetical protein